MAMERYPEIFPLPQRDPFTYAVDMAVRRSPIATGAPRQRRKYQWQPHYFSLEFIVPIEMLFQWQSWINGKGYNWFELPVMNAVTADGQPCSNYCVVRFTSNLSVSHLNFESLRVAVSAELAPGQLEL